ncbi:hypothetical protein BVD86_09060 [Acinetobacter pittii]|nr:hypothetical protein BVD86_09060 [Acinetobacter pittii]MDB0116199.1 hypothetical protein [Acinetobacter baumannii]OTU02204.1 hypothetical protein CAT68_02575 [Acinetobacter baumannii]
MFWISFATAENQFHIVIGFIKKDKGNLHMARHSLMKLNYCNSPKLKTAVTEHLFFGDNKHGNILLRTYPTAYKFCHV